MAEVQFIDAEGASTELRWAYIGRDKKYHVYVGDVEVYTTEDARDRDLFMAQLYVYAISHR
jgi:hypothetical protein